MALEDTIAANTAAVLALTAALNKPLWLDPSLRGLTGAAVVTNNTKAETIGKIAGDVASAAVGLTGAAPLAQDAGALVTITVTDVLNAASQLIAKTSKANLSETLKDFNAKKISEIAPEHLQAALEKLNAAIAAADQKAAA